MPNCVSYGKLLKGVKAAILRGEYNKILKMVGQIQNNYDFRTLLLIYSQSPNVTIVKSFCEWSKLGRGLKKGSRRIYIYVPINNKKQRVIEGQQNINGKIEKQKDQSNKIEVIEGNSYKRRIVYDVSNTYQKKGERRVIVFNDIKNENRELKLYNILLELLPVKVKQKPLSEMEKGFYDGKNNKITTNTILEKDEKTAILLYKLCDCLYDDFLCDDFSDKKEQKRSKIFARSVSFLVADYFGLDTSMYEFNDLITWVKDDFDSFMRISNKIKKTADELIELIKSSKFKQEKISA